MSQNTHLQSVYHEHNVIDFLAFALERQLKIEPKSKRILVDLSQYFELLEFQLGDLLENLASASPNLAQQEKLSHSSNKDCQQTQFFFIICQGRVRLLSFDAEKQREVSTGLLTEGKTFGGELLFNETYMPYKAIAAESKVIVARIPIARLQPQLAQSPQLKEHWFIETQNRQGLIFLKL